MEFLQLQVFDWGPSISALKVLKLSKDLPGKKLSKRSWVLWVLVTSSNEAGKLCTLWFLVAGLGFHLEDLELLTVKEFLYQPGWCFWMLLEVGKGHLKGGPWLNFVVSAVICCDSQITNRSKKMHYMHCKWYCWLSHCLGQEGSAGKALSSSSWTCSAGRCLFCALRTAKTIIRYQPLWFRWWGKHSNKVLSRKTTGGGVLTATEWKLLKTCWWVLPSFSEWLSTNWGGSGNSFSTFACIAPVASGAA